MPASVPYDCVPVHRHAAHRPARLWQVCLGRGCSRVLRASCVTCRPDIIVQAHAGVERVHICSVAWPHRSWRSMCMCVFHWQGAGEAVLRHVYERARSKAPSVVVIHDVDVLGMLLQQQGVADHSSLTSSLTTLRCPSQHRCRTRAWCSTVSPRGCWLAWMRFVNMAGVWLQLVLLMTAAGCVCGGCSA